MVKTWPNSDDFELIENYATNMDYPGTQLPLVRMNHGGSWHERDAYIVLFIWANRWIIVVGLTLIMVLVILFPRPTTLNALLDYLATRWKVYKIS